TIPSASAFPRSSAGRLLHHPFRGLLSVYSCYGLHARQVAFATLCTRGFSSLVASTAALIATGWSEPVPGRVYPRCGPAPFTAHDEHGLGWGSQRSAMATSRGQVIRSFWLRRCSARSQRRITCNRKLRRLARFPGTA